MQTLLIGLGNPILGDDGVGWKVAEEIAKLEVQNSNFEIDYLSLGGLSLMERMIGYERVILVDAISVLPGGPHGEGAVGCINLEDLAEASAGHISAAHDTSLKTAIQLGRTMGASLPSEVVVVGIQAQRVYDFSEELSPVVAAAVPQAVQVVLELLSSSA